MSAKQFVIPKRLIWEAYRRVKANTLSEVLQLKVEPKLGCSGITSTFL